MPKKHSPAYTTTKPNYVHPSLQSSRATASSAPTTPQTVNQRIAQLRREQTPRATTEQRDELTSLVSSRTVPPDLRRILHIPEVNAPKPKPGTRPRMRNIRGERLPPGPAVPLSWLLNSRWAGIVEVKKVPAKKLLPQLGTLASLTQTDFKHLFPIPRTLQHLCLRTLAQHWVELSEFEQYYIPTLSVLMREALLCYLTLYGERGCLNYTSFKILFQNAGNAWHDVQFLDLTGLLNDDFTINDLSKCLKRVLPQVSEQMDNLTIIESSSTNGKTKATSAIVADSWDDEADDDDIPTESLPAELTTPHFSNLTRLSLAHAGKYASWPDLLKLSPNLNKITHLSLAYWPRPTLTPNSSTTFMVSDHRRINLSGTSYYADLDADYHEAANILRRFSTNTYSLEWLDLEGCMWIKALTCKSSRSSSPPPNAPNPRVGKTWNALDNSPQGPHWNAAWQRITYLNVFQGWIPGHEQSLRNMPGGVIPMQLMRWLREAGKDEEVERKLERGEREHRDVVMWIAREKTNRAVASGIQEMRRKEKGSYCQVDFGWVPVGGEIVRDKEDRV